MGDGVGDGLWHSDDANKYTQVSRIKERVEEKEGIPPAQQRLIFGGKQMYVPSFPLSLPSVLEDRGLGVRLGYT